MLKALTGPKEGLFLLPTVTQLETVLQQSSLLCTKSLDDSLHFSLYATVVLGRIYLAKRHCLQLRGFDISVLYITYLKKRLLQFPSVPICNDKQDCMHQYRLQRCLFATIHSKMFCNLQPKAAQWESPEVFSWSINLLKWLMGWWRAPLRHIPSA